MKRNASFKTIIIVTLMAAPVVSTGSTLDTLLDRIDLSGYFRVRMWDIAGRTYVPDTLPSRHGYKNINYLDLFLRSRINLAIIPEIEIRTVFDISSLFGKGSSSIDSGKGDFIVRDVYALFRPVNGSELSIGLLPFSLPGGYIIARDATGIQYSHHFPKIKTSLYAGYIRAFDNADDSFGHESDMPEYVMDNVLFLGSRFSIGSIISGEAYYVFEDDRYTTNRLTLRSLNFRYDRTAGGFMIDTFDPDRALEGDGRKVSLHWLGLHWKIMSGRWFLRFGGIFNTGIIRIRNELYLFRRVRIMAGLFECEAGFDNRDLQFSLIAEGATGDPDRPHAGISFQQIKGSHDFSLIAVDSTGGLALRGSGKSQWYGLYGCGVKARYTVLDSLIMEMKLLHFGTTKVMYWRGRGTTWFGDEVDISAEYRFRNILSVFLTAGGFLPQRAYNAQRKMSNSHWGYFSEFETDLILRDLDNYSSKSMIFEFMVGMKVSFD
ncbi:MAG: hypothetical protein KA369_10990 [Spirochaetes bacterium]|nr:hypothetical protein [Spirochaetota bacterium]